MLRASLRIGITLALVGLPARTAPAQWWGYGGGSTVQGDILRGEGMFLRGAGVYVYNQAVADSINLNTAIRFNEYIYGVAKQQNLENARHRAQIIARNREHYETILKRIRESPEPRDLENGDSLNALMAQLLDPQISPSAFRLTPVALPGDTIRGIPFFYGPEDAIFSMRRLSSKGKGTWPVGLRRAPFDPLRRNYEHAFDDALDQQIDGKLSHEAILRVEQALGDLEEKLPNVIPATSDKVYIESRDYLKKLRTAKELLKRNAIEKMLGEIDKYNGTTIHDLVTFMQKYNLRFGVADLGFERELYPKLYESMKQQLEIVRGPGDPMK